MKPERWQQLDSIFHSALQCEPAERSAFLDEACAGDELLRKEVEALLSAHEEAGSFIESPALDVEARSLANDQNESLVGQTIGHYKIISSIGAGGMGEVYLAEDTQLGRKIAIKILPAEFTRNIDRVRRFQQEARAASALNHPNIITIYEIGQLEDRHFMATEFIDGETLRGRISGVESRTTGAGRGKSGTSSQLRDILNIAIQVADALAAAHEAGIVHRDIKPENIMVRRRDGYVKVLDFGLAKLTEGTVDSEAQTRTQVKTSAGVVMGTANYMSPEQARGEKVDARTDIWSLGVVLYELVAGCAPFEKSTPSEVIAWILEREPPPLARFAREVPLELERIVDKALTKDREERYQTAKDLLVDLRRLRQRLEVDAAAERSRPQVLSDEVEIATNVTQATTVGARADTQAETVRQTSSAEYLLTGIKRHKQVAVVALSISVVLLGGIGVGLYKFVNHRRPKTAPFDAIKFTKLVTPGNARLPSISPDGKSVVYVVDAEGQQSLWINQVATSSNHPIIPAAEVVYGRPSFSHDGNYVYYVVKEKEDPNGALYRVPFMGGAPRKLLVNIQSAITVSPDDKRLAFYRYNPGEGEMLLMLADADGNGEQKLTSRKGDEWFENSALGNMGPSWSPDGKVIACGAGKASAGRLPATVIVVQVEDGAQKEFTSQRWHSIGNLAWLGDGSGLMLGAAMQRELAQIWRLSYPGGEARQLTDDFRRNSLTSITADSTTMVGSQADQITNIWVAPGGVGSLARQITSSEQAGIGMDLAWASWTPDGKIVYNSNASGNFDIWIMNSDGTDKKQLTFDPSLDLSPAMTPNGRYILFSSGRTGKSSVLDMWRMDADGSHPKQLTNGIEDAGPQSSPDSMWVVYGNEVSGKYILWKVAIDGGNPVQLTNKSSRSPVVSPDGRWIACLYWDEQSDSPEQIAVIPFEGGGSIKAFSTHQNGFLQDVRWMPDGRAISYVDTRGDVSNIWSQPIDGGPARQLTNFKDQIIFSHDWSHDGKQLVFARGVRMRTIGFWTDSR
ncbi:MAG TPA: protein kinase [Pyrinomonadaceae bacterium]|nr:protein kinase [Pyrinomonadaceae bacterium]